MKNRTLRRAAETLVLLLIAAMALLLAAGLHQHEPDEAFAALSTGWYQLTDGVRRDVTLPATLPAEPRQTLTLYNDTLTDSDGGKVLSARGVEYGIEIRAGETLLYRYEDNAFPKNAQMKGRLWADAELPDNIGEQTLSLTLTPLSGRAVALAAPVLGTAPAVTGHHIQSSLFSIGMMLAMLVLAVLALLIFFYMGFFGIRELRFLDVAVFLLLCSLWCLTDSALYQIYGRDGAAGSVISFYAFMTMPVPMVHFVRNTVSGRLRLVPDVCIALFCANALAQGAAYRLLGVPFIAMLPLTHLLLTAGVAAMLTVLFRSYRDKPAPQLRLRIAAFAALGAFDKSLHHFKGEAICFDSEEAAEEAILAGKIHDGHVVVIRYEGPKGGPGMREMFKAMKYLYGRGLAKTTALITDGRFSGTNNGCFVGHISPEAAEGGPIAIVHDGDTIEIDVDNKQLNLLVPDEEIEARLKQWKRPEPKFKKGWLGLYCKLAASGSEGGVMKFDHL